VTFATFDDRQRRAAVAIGLRLPDGSAGATGSGGAPSASPAAAGHVPEVEP
jgi:hypothetical protein